MKILVRVLNGDCTALEVTDEMKISEVKSMIEKELKVPVNQQTLVHLGKTLRDDKTIGDYDKIKEVAKLHLLVKKTDTLQVALSRYLRNYFDEEQTKTIMEEFMKEFDESIKTLSLDDIERIATSFLQDEKS